MLHDMLVTDCGLALLFLVGRTGSGKVHNSSSAFCEKSVYKRIIEFTHAFTVALHFDGGKCLLRWNSD